MLGSFFGPEGSRIGGARVPGIGEAWVAEFVQGYH